MGSFSSSRDHLIAELERVDLLLQSHVARARRFRRSDDRFQGLYIQEEEVDALLARPVGLPPWAARGGDSGASSYEHAAELARRLEEEADVAVRRGARLRLRELASRFDLDGLDRDALIVCLAPEVDLRYERLFAYLQDDVTKKRPSVDLVLNVLVSSLDEKLTALERFRPGAPLIDHELVAPFDDPNHHAPPLLGKFLKVDERVVSFLLDSDAIDARLRPFAHLIEPSRPLAELPLSVETRDRLASLGGSDEVRQRGVLLYLEGPRGSGRRLAAEGLSGVLGRKLLVVDVGAMLEADAARVATDVRRAAREALFQESSILLEGFDALLADGREALRDTVLGDLTRWPLPVLLAGETPWVPATEAPPVALRLRLSAPDSLARLALWRGSLDGRAQGFDDGVLRDLASKFRLGPEQISAAVAGARNLARSLEPVERQLAVGDIEEAARLQSTRGLSKLARRIDPRYTWDDIVLPPDRLALLREICSHVRYRAVVYGEWGFDRKLSLGKGLSVLFSGPPGTGKTMAAEILARELGLELYKIDLSSVVSKYIGETEKNLSRIFNEAESSNAILFFDEADALFGKRTAVRDAHDRHANVEVSYLLQRMEEYEGVVVLASNLRKNMDEAFVRRLRFTVEFPFPDEESRRRIWEGIWPAETPRAEDLDLRAIARTFEFAGGNIRNVGVAAAFRAAKERTRIDMGHVMRAGEMELKKMGAIDRSPRTV